MVKLSPFSLFEKFICCLKTYLKLHSSKYITQQKLHITKISLVVICDEHSFKHIDRSALLKSTLFDTASSAAHQIPLGRKMLWIMIELIELRACCKECIGTLQMKGRWESNINVFFGISISQYCVRTLGSVKPKVHINDQHTNFQFWKLPIFNGNN